MQIPLEYRRAAHRSAIFNEIAKLLMTRLLVNENDPLLSPRLFMNDAAVPEAAFHEVLLEILTLKREADRVVESYEWVLNDPPAPKNLPDPRPSARGALSRDRAPRRRRTKSR